MKLINSYQQVQNLELVWVTWDKYLPVIGSSVISFDFLPVIVSPFKLVGSFSLYIILPKIDCTGQQNETLETGFSVSYLG